MSKSKHTITLDDAEVTLISEVQYGVRFPDGSVAWAQMEYSNGRMIDFEKLVKGTDDAKSGFFWRDRLRKRAEGAHIDVETYTGMHQFLKRTVTFSATVAEKVQAA
ncbi:MAG TPA: hypothetical protein DDY41_17680 [Arthrobacter bacterium]|jgi:hypothetical protein|nr:hypothetical protein [Arthrobacter sp.]